MSDDSGITNVCVLGTGAWGTVLALICVRRGLRTTLLCRSAEEAARLRADRENRRFLPDVPLPEPLLFSADAAQALARAELLVLAPPAQRLRENLGRLAPVLPRQTILLVASKGIELDSGLRMSEVVAQTLGGRRNACLTLSGPNLSGEIARGLPASSVVAGTPAHADEVRRVQAALSYERFRLYSSADQIGVEIGGAMKNPIAIACGVGDGLDHGHNARAGLITRGLVEVQRLARACGGRARTISGLAGLGDLITTAASPASRNYALGYALGQGQTLAEYTATALHIAEGVPTTHAALALAKRHNVELRITGGLSAVLNGDLTPQEWATMLISRLPGEE